MELTGILARYLVVAFLGILVLPVAFHLFQFLPDHGITFIKPLGLVLVGFVYWFLESLNLLSNDNGGFILAVAVVRSLF